MYVNTDEKYRIKRRMARNHFKHYGLEKKTIRITKTTSINKEYDKFNTSVYPWAYAEQKVRVVQETPWFITIEILAHYNPYGSGETTPYTTSIHKSDIENEEFVLKTLAGDRIL